MTFHHFEPFFERVTAATQIRSQTELAAVLGINRSAITQAKKKGTIPANWILGLSRKFGLNPDWLERGIGDPRENKIDHDPEFEKIPKVNARLCAGGGSFEVGSNIQGFYAFRKDWLSRKGSAGSMVLMDIFGNSMAPELKDGDTVLVDESQKAIIAGALYAVGIEDTVMVKRVEKHPNNLVLQSDNKDYAPIFLQEAEMNMARIIGKVVWVSREYR
ncbi:MAG: helix-turn-helix transcriptional regulator [Deltaproteobacteria bacterium]|jgi:phage repressor protein C with HTH and peptisase S24 domain|nr:helix-turn-helix transcriptional regulator [Deltaproteobacteria bacterium]